ncbi:MAG: transglutaminase domain-containing protein [Candidatus Saccharimonadales bacterium]
MPKYIIAVGAAIALVLIMLPVTATASSSHDFAIDHRFSVGGDGVDARHIVTVTNRSSTALSELEMYLPLVDVEGLAVEYSNGDEIAFEVNESRSLLAGAFLPHSVINLDFPKEVRGNNKSFKFEISYSSASYPRGLVDNHTLVLPFLDGNVESSWSARVNVPGDWPAINYRPDVHGFDIGGSVAKYRFDSRDYDQPIVALSFAEGARYDIEHTQEIRNRSLLPRFVSITLPLDTHSQNSLLKSLEPTSSKVEVDKDGNIIASYWLWPFQSKTITYSSQVIAGQLRYNSEKPQPIADTPEELSDMVRGSRYWTTQGEAGQQATGLIDPDSSAWDNMQAILSFVIEEIDYVDEVDERMSADDILASGEGDIEGNIDLLVTMLRSVSIPTRMVYGVAHPSHGLSDQPYMHVWAESYIAGIGWVNIDPVSHQLFNNRGYSSSNLIGLLAVSSDDQMKLIDNLRPPQTLTAAAEELENDDPLDSLSIDIRQYIFFPGLILDVDKITNLGSSTVDEVAIDDKDIGSIGPSSSIAIRSWRFGSWQEREALVSIGEDELTASSSNYWWPLITLSVIVALIGVLQFIRYRRNIYLKERLDGKVLH